MDIHPCEKNLGKASKGKTIFLDESRLCRVKALSGLGNHPINNSWYTYCVIYVDAQCQSEWYRGLSVSAIFCIDGFLFFNKYYRDIIHLNLMNL